MQKIYLFLLVSLIVISCGEQKQPQKEESKAKTSDSSQKPFIPYRPGAMAQQQTPTNTDQQVTNGIDPANPKNVDEIIILHFMAKGGIDRIKSTKSLKVVGSMTSMGQQAGFTMLYKRPYSIKMLMKVSGKDVIQAFDGKEGWVKFGDSTQTLPPQAAEEFKRKTDILEGPFYDYKNKGLDIKMAGKEKVDGKQNFKLSINVGEKNVQQWVYVDCTNFLISKIKTKLSGEGKTQTIEMYVKNYKDVGGLIMSHLNETKVDGKLVASMVYDKIELNVNLDDSVFKKPSK
jgi:outer membrane lipoprotein-sorting protein